MIFYKIFSYIYKRAARSMCLDCKDFIKNGAKILDLGCGSGIAGDYFKKFFKAEVFGVDIKNNRVVDLPFKKIDGKNLPFDDNSFDAVLICYVLHHAEDPIAVLKEARRVGKERIVIYEDMADGFFSKLFCRFHGLSFDIFFQGFVGKKRENPEYFFKGEKEWQGIFKGLGLKIVFEKRISLPISPVAKRIFILDIVK